MFIKTSGQLLLSKNKDVKKTDVLRYKLMIYMTRKDIDKN